MPMYTTVKKFGYFFFQEINAFTQQVKLKLIEFKTLLQRISISNYCKLFLFIKESWKKYHGFHKNIKQHNCFQHW